MIHPAEVDCLSPEIFIWHRDALELKAEIFATGIRGSSGIILVDPFEANTASFAQAIGSARVAGIALTNANHQRDCLPFAKKFSVPIYAHQEAKIALNLSELIALEDGDELSGDLRVIAIEGAAPGELVFYSDAAGGTLIVGDALINFGAHGFTFLPAKYCSNARLMRKSLHRLLDFSFKRILFAHGAPILKKARLRLEALLRA